MATYTKKEKKSFANGIKVGSRNAKKATAKKITAQKKSTKKSVTRDGKPRADNYAYGYNAGYKEALKNWYGE